MTSHYVLYGLRLSADQPVPALRESPAASVPDVRLHFSAPPPITHFARARALDPWAPPGYTPQGGSAGHSIWRDAERGMFLFRYQDGTEFVLDDLGANIWISWAPPLTQADAVTYLIGPIIGFVLRWRGRLCLHASCVCSGDRAFALMGSAGAGKSTTASTFASLSCPVLSDDITVLEEHGDEFVVQPGYPRTCLWPEAVAALFGKPDALPRITPSWDKRHLDLTRERGGFQAEPVPLDAVYVLSDRVGEGDPVLIEDLEPGHAVVTIVGHTYGNRLLDADMRGREFAALDRFVRKVPVRRVAPPASLERIVELCERILDDFSSVRTG